MIRAGAFVKKFTDSGSFSLENSFKKQLPSNYREMIEGMDPGFSQPCVETRVS